MKIDVQYGADTGMCLVDVYLDSDRETGLSHGDVWAELLPLFAAEGVDVTDVVDVFLHRRGPAGEWVSAGLLPWEA